MGKPQWATPERQLTLIRLWRRYGGRCLQDHHHCTDLVHYLHQTRRVAVRRGYERATMVTATNGQHLWVQEFPLESVVLEKTEMAHAYGLAEEGAIETWKADDRDRRSQERIEASQTAPTGQVGRFGSFSTTFRTASDPIRWDEHCQERPEFYFKGEGVDRGRPFAKVRVTGTGILLFVDTSAAYRGRKARRNARRRGEDNPSPTVEDICVAAVRQWWAN